MNLNTKGKINTTILTLLVIVVAGLIILVSASLNNPIPDQILSVNSSSELNLSAYFTEFSESVWFSASRTGNLSVLFGTSLSEPWKFYRSSDVTIIPFRDWVGEESIEFKATDGEKILKKSVIVRVAPSTTTTSVTIPLITTTVTTTGLTTIPENRQTGGVEIQSLPPEKPAEKGREIRLAQIYNSMIYFTSPTPANNSYIPRNFTEINLTINSSTLDAFIFSWNNTNYSFYDSSLVLAMNFNNNSGIGENSTHAKDISKYGNNGTTNSTPQSPIWNSSGRFGSALQFDGVDHETSLQLCRFQAFEVCDFKMIMLMLGMRRV